jgi:hypothetical protein
MGCCTGSTSRPPPSRAQSAAARACSLRSAGRPAASRDAAVGAEGGKSMHQRAPLHTACRQWRRRARHPARRRRPKGSRTGGGWAPHSPLAALTPCMNPCGVWAAMHCAVSPSPGCYRPPSRMCARRASAWRDVLQSIQSPSAGLCSGRPVPSSLIPLIPVPLSAVPLRSVLIRRPSLPAFGSPQVRRAASERQPPHQRQSSKAAQRQSSQMTTASGRLRLLPSAAPARAPWCAPQDVHGAWAHLPRCRRVMRSRCVAAVLLASLTGVHGHSSEGLRIAALVLADTAGRAHMCGMGRPASR